jgi:hypothetical protein
MPTNHPQQHFVPRHPQPMFFSTVKDQILHSYKQDAKLVFSTF